MTWWDLCAVILPSICYVTVHIYKYQQSMHNDLIQLDKYISISIIQFYAALQIPTTMADKP